MKNPLSFMTRYITFYLALLLFTFCQTPQKKEVNVESIAPLAEKASKNGEWLKAAQLYEQLSEAEPTQEEWNYQTGTNYLKANHPQKALKILTSFDKRNSKIGKFNGRIARIAKAHYQLGEYEKIVEIYNSYHYPKMYRGLAREYLKALIQLNNPAKFVTAFINFQQNGIYDDKGKQTNTGFLYRAVCNEFLLVGKSNLLKNYAEKYHYWATARQEKDKRNLAIATFYQQDFNKAIIALKTAISVEKSPRHRMELEGLLGICFAKNNGLEKAKLQIERIKNFEDLPNRHDAFGAKFYHQARIEVALNQQEKAISSLKNALAAKGEFWSNRFREDGLLKGLFEEKGFKELVHAQN